MLTSSGNSGGVGTGLAALPGDPQAVHRRIEDIAAALDQVTLQTSLAALDALIGTRHQRGAAAAQRATAIAAGLLAKAEAVDLEVSRFLSVSDPA